MNQRQVSGVSRERSRRSEDEWWYVTRWPRYGGTRGSGPVSMCLSRSSFVKIVLMGEEVEVWASTTIVMGGRCSVFLLDRTGVSGLSGRRNIFTHRLHCRQYRRQRRLHCVHGNEKGVESGSVNGTIALVLVLSSRSPSTTGKPQLASAVPWRNPPKPSADIAYLVYVLTLPTTSIVRYTYISSHPHIRLPLHMPTQYRDVVLRSDGGSRAMTIQCILHR